MNVLGLNFLVFIEVRFVLLLGKEGICSWVAYADGLELDSHILLIHNLVEPSLLKEVCGSKFDSASGLATSKGITENLNLPESIHLFVV